MKVILTDIPNPNFEIEGEYRIVKPVAEGVDPKQCIGCFSCWMKDPGKCALVDGFEENGALLGKCDEMIYICRCTYGSISPFVKMVLDRSISYVHPYFVMRKGEMHHKRRYDNTITLSAYFYGENITDAEKETARKMLEAHAINFDGFIDKVGFYESAEELEGLKI